MDSKRKVSKVFNNNPQGSRQRGRPKNRWQKCVKTDINKCKITNWKERSRNRADWEKSMKEAWSHGTGNTDRDCIHTVHLNNIWATQQNAGQTQHQKCRPTT